MSFYRIFHYVTGKYVQSAGHSFTQVTNTIYGVGKLDHMWGLMPKFFFKPTINLSKKYKGTTNVTIGQLIQNQKFGSLPVKKHSDLLDDKWEELYQIEEPDVKQVRDCYNKIIKT